MEFKVHNHSCIVTCHININRIKVEFKEITQTTFSERTCDINRIKVEFKDIRTLHRWHPISILIESKWNLKALVKNSSKSSVNINRIKVEFKALFYTLPSGPLRHINRIKVEFKVGLTNERIPESFYINRIKVEFKVCCSIFNAPRFSILIESKWNLKLGLTQQEFADKIY